MKHPRFLALLSAGFCLIVAISAVWIWRTLSPARFEATARLAVVIDPAAKTGDGPAGVDEAQVLSPEVLSAAAILIADRRVPLSLGSPFDSVTDYLIDRIRVGRPERGAADEILITCAATSGEESLQILTAVVDAYLDAATTVQPVRSGSDADDSPAAELQIECDQLAKAIEQQQQGIAEASAQLEAAKEAAAGYAGNDPITLEAELVQARRASSDSAARLAAAQQDVEKKLPLEVIAARIADVPTRTRVLERLNQAKIKNELEQQTALHQKWSAVYGRNHPRMAELRAHIESLEMQIGQFHSNQQDNGQLQEQTSRDQSAPSGEQGPPADVPVASAPVLAALESEATGSRQAEQALETRLTAAQQGLQQQHELEARLSESRQELEFLHGEHGRLWKEIDSSRRSQTNDLATVIEPPGLSRNANAPQPGVQVAAACVAGMVLCLLVIWQIRRRLPVAAEKTDTAEVEWRPAAGRERFRSHEEEQLLRLKLQAAR